MHAKKYILIGLTLSFTTGITQNTHGMLKPLTQYLKVGLSNIQNTQNNLINKFAQTKLNNQETRPGYSDPGNYTVFLAQKGDFDTLEQQLKNTTNLKLISLEHLYMARESSELKYQVKNLLDLCINEKLNNPEYAPKFDQTGYMLVFLTETKQDDLIKHVLKKNFNKISMYYFIKAINIATQNNQTKTLEIFTKFLDKKNNKNPKKKKYEI